MARIARAVAPGHPHHVWQRGNRRQDTFFSHDDYRLYLKLLSEESRRADVAIWAYCLMPNHVHLILTPRDAAGLSRAVGETHRRYTTSVNGRNGWTGFLWQGRFGSSALSESYLLEAVRYICLNPVRAKLADRPESWPWSSARAFSAAKSDGIVDVGPVLLRVQWDSFIKNAADQIRVARIRHGIRTGRPVGDDRFIGQLERELSRTLGVRKRGRKPHPHPESGD